MHTTLAAVAIVGVVFVVAGVALVMLLRDSLTDSVRDAATLRANDVAGALRTAGSTDAIDLPADEDVLVQVVDGSGKVSAASPNVAGDSPMAAIPAGSSARVDDVPVRDDDEVEGEDLLVVARRAPSGAGGDGGGDAGGLILVGRTLESVDESVTLTMRSLLVGIPVLLVVVGLVTWLIVGRALAPVERARAEVAEISDRDLHRRVPEPPTNDEIGRLARRSTPCSPGSRMRRPGSAGSSPTRRTSCGARWRASATTPRSRSLIPRARRSRSSPTTSSPRICASSSSSTTSPGSPGPTSTHRQHRAPPSTSTTSCSTKRAACRDTGTPRVDTAAVSAGRVNGDAGQLRRLTRNLLDNAARHARAR